MKRWIGSSTVARLAPFAASALLALAPLQALAGNACPAVTRIGVSDLGDAAFRNGDKVGGLQIDIARELSRRSGCRIEFLWFPRQRLFVELEAGHIDMTLGSLRTPERDAYAAFLPYGYVQYDLILSRQHDGERHFTSLADYVEHGSGRLNIARGMHYDAAVDEQLARLSAAGRVEVVNDFETAFNKMEMGRADGTLASPPIYGKYLKASHLKDKLVAIPLPESVPHFTGIYLSRRGMPAGARERFATALKAMVAEQSIQVHYARYFDEATIKRLFKPGAAPLAAALAAAPAQ